MFCYLLIHNPCFFPAFLPPALECCFIGGAPPLTSSTRLLRFSALNVLCKGTVGSSGEARSLFKADPLKSRPAGDIMEGLFGGRCDRFLCSPEVDELFDVDRCRGLAFGLLRGGGGGASVFLMGSVGPIMRRSSQLPTIEQ